MWAGGMTADEMAEFSLSWRPEDYLKVQWTGLPRFALSAVRGFTGLGSGEALERLFDRRLWRMSAGETAIPLHTLAYDMDRGSLEPLGTTRTPDLTLGELARIAVARPLVADAVRVEGDLLVDGAVVNGFPADLLDDDLDHVVGLNVMLPAGLEGEDISGWERRRSGVADAGRQLEMANQLELARRTRRRLEDRLTLVEPVPYEGLRAMSFYELFLDRRDWPALIRGGYRATVEALRPLRRRKQARPRSRRGASA
jgi:predicted acylesterase/phospholipase RssA